MPGTPPNALCATAREIFGNQRRQVPFEGCRKFVESKTQVGHVKLRNIATAPAYGQASLKGRQLPDPCRVRRRDFARLEERRHAGMKLLTDGWRPAEVARQLGVSDVSVLRWKRALVSKGAEAWRRGRLGKPPKVTERHLLVLQNLLETSCTQYGYSDDRWTYRRLAIVLRDLTGLSVHPDHLSRVIRGQNRGGSHPWETIHGAWRGAMEASAA